MEGVTLGSVTGHTGIGQQATGSRQREGPAAQARTLAGGRERRGDRRSPAGTDSAVSSKQDGVCAQFLTPDGRVCGRPPVAPTAIAAREA